jgi:hypothetical protein
VILKTRGVQWMTFAIQTLKIRDHIDSKINKEKFIPFFNKHGPILMKIHKAYPCLIAFSQIRQIEEEGQTEEEKKNNPLKIIHDLFESDGADLEPYY